MIKAEILADSIAMGNRLTTFRLTYPRFIHSELMTHRAFSRNAASSRAIPFGRMVDTIKTDMATPEVWGSAQPGMQSGAEVVDKRRAYNIWENAMFEAIRYARELDKMGIHKSISNRLLEPFAHMVTIVSATEYANFFYLRANPAAMPEFRILAFRMLALYVESTPKELATGQWHTPLAGEEIPPNARMAVSTARCARVSYMNFKDTTVEEDIELHDRLAASGHWSPFEHVATPVYGIQNSNFRGWQQYRKIFENENVRTVVYKDLLEANHE